MLQSQEDVAVGNTGASKVQMLGRPRKIISGFAALRALLAQVFSFQGTLRISAALKPSRHSAL